MKKVIQYAVSLTLAGGLLYWVFKDVDLNLLWESIKGADYKWVGLSAILGFLAHWSRAYRWKLMLEPIGYNPSVTKTTVSVLIGYFVNLLLPRAGEFARSASLKKLDDVPFEKSFGATVAERVIDVGVLLFLIGLNLLLEFSRLSGLFQELVGEKLSNPVLLLGILAVLLITAFLVFSWLKKNDLKLQQNKIYTKLRGVFMGLWEGFSAVRNLKSPGLFLFHTLFIWTMYYLMTWFLCFALPQTADLSPLAGLTILVMGTIGMAAPTIGGIGSYHFLVGKIVSLYGLNAQDGITLATFLHTMQGIIFVIVFGLGAFIVSFFIQKNRPETDPQA